MRYGAVNWVLRYCFDDLHVCMKSKAAFLQRGFEGGQACQPARKAAPVCRGCDNSRLVIPSEELA